MFDHRNHARKAKGVCVDHGRWYNIHLCRTLHSGEVRSRPGRRYHGNRRFAEQGVREAALLGQNVNAYCGLMHGEVVDFAALHYGGHRRIERIRFTTSHPVEFTDSLIEAYAEI